MSNSAIQERTLDDVIREMTDVVREIGELVAEKSEAGERTQ